MTIEIKKFLNRLFVFCVFVLGAMVLNILIVILTERYLITFEIPKNKTTLFIGDSHIQCAINDTILTNSYNFAQAGSGQFYTYLKLRKIIEENQQINKVVIGYSFIDIAKSRDGWFNGDKIKYKLSPHLFLFSMGDFYDIMISNPKEVILNTYRVCMQGVNHIIIYWFSDIPLSSWGKFKTSQLNKLEEAKKNIQLEGNLKYNGTSVENIRYLSKSYQYLLSKNIDIILLNTPVHPLYNEHLNAYVDRYFALTKELFPSAVLIDHSSFQLQNEFYLDLSHLNSKGAKTYSMFLLKNKLFQ